MAEGTPIIIKKKKGHGGHGHHGGSWKVAYADFVTAMMAFFMVMWIMGLSDQSKAQVQGYFNDPSGFMRSMPRSHNIINLKTAPPKRGESGGNGGHGEAEGKEMQSVAGDVKKELEKAFAKDPTAKAMIKNIEESMTDEGLRIEFVESAGTVFFESGSFAFRKEALPIIRTVGRVLHDSKRKIVLEGHTDARPYSGHGYDNWNLSTDRALAMYRGLMGAGVPEIQFTMVRGLAATQLKTPGDPLNPVNRRVTILLPFGEKLRTDGFPKDEIREAKAEAHPKGRVNLAPREVFLRNSSR